MGKWKTPARNRGKAHICNTLEALAPFPSPAMPEKLPVSHRGEWGMRTCKGEQRHEETETAYVRPAVLLGTALPVWAEDAAAGTPAPDSAGQAEEVAPAAEAQQGRPNEAAPAEAGGVQAPAQPQAAAVPQAEWGTDYEAAEEFTVSTEAELRAFAAMVNGGRLCRQNGEAGKQHRHEQRALGACRNCGIYVRR